MKQRFQSLVTTGRFTLPMAIAFSVACWLLSYVLSPDAEAVQLGYRLLGFLLYGVIGFMLIQFNNQFAIIRIRASVQTSVYFLLIGVCPALHTVVASDIGTLFFLVALFCLFNSYRRRRPEGMLFLSYASIGLGSLFFPQLTFFVPLFWWGAYEFHSLTQKSFFASLIGWLLPYWFLFGYSFCFDRMELFYRPFLELATFTPLWRFDMQPWTLATLGYSFVLFIAGTMHSLAVSYDDKIQTRSYLQFLIMLSLYTFIYMLLQPSMVVALLPLLFMGISILSGHFFALTDSRGSNIFFILMLVALLALFIFNLLITNH